MKPEEGYDLTWISAERRSDKTPCQVKPSKKRTARPPKHSVSMGDFSSVSQSLNSIEDLSTRESCAGEENKLSSDIFLSQINCDDGSVKDMNLSVERWEPIRDDADEQKTLAAVDE
nr:uncharacterized protein LOC109191612 [Ipomoea batatas]